jgi:hypothetical protein
VTQLGHSYLRQQNSKDEWTQVTNGKMSTCVIEPDATGASDAKANYPVALAIDATDAIESSRPANIPRNTLVKVEVKISRVECFLDSDRFHPTTSWARFTSKIRDKVLPSGLRSHACLHHLCLHSFSQPTQRGDRVERGGLRCPFWVVNWRSSIS